ncbi:hypothetical protein Glove_296g13 [Diversispora epigaea]|uniref:Uncharacterized protein n=1 Tax=Diversispora epigaea TaxID=1348612 RepID=A0A397I5V3_9GLOM|nr:hypothetical protein Glove_296g13 [Diversispora epigaea]
MPRNTRKSKINNNNKEATATSSTSVSTPTSASRSIATTRSTLKLISKLTSKSILTKSKSSASTLTTLTPTASTPTASTPTASTTTASTTTASTTTASTTTASTTTASTPTESIPTESTPTASTPTASTQSASFPIFKRKSQSSSSLDEANKKKQTNKFGANIVSEPFIETDMYPDLEKLKKETKNYINSTNPGFLAKYSEKRWNSYFEKSIHSKLLLKLRSKRGNMVAKIKSSIFSTFGEDSLSSINTSATEKEIMDWKKKEVRKAFKKLHKKINEDDDDEKLTWCNRILQKAFTNPAKKTKYLLAFAVGVIEITLDPDNGGIQIKDVIMKSKIRKYIINEDDDDEKLTWCNRILQKAFTNPAKKTKYLLAFAVGVIEITLDPDNGGIQIKDVIMKSKIRKYIDKIENGNIYISSSESESSSGSVSEFEKDNNDNMNEDNEDDGVIYIDSNEENDINLDEYNIDESDME